MSPTGNPDTLREHGALAGALIGKIALVTQELRLRLRRLSQPTASAKNRGISVDPV